MAGAPPPRAEITQTTARIKTTRSTANRISLMGEGVPAEETDQTLLRVTLLPRDGEPPSRAKPPPSRAVGAGWEDLGQPLHGLGKIDPEGPAPTI